MGRLLRRPGTGAIAITCAAVLLPCAVWYWLGARQLESVVSELREGAKREATTTARQMATRLALQLEDLRKSESERSHLDYWPEYLWRGQRCGTLKVRRSPLATSQQPHAVHFYFQVDDQGEITSPRMDMDLSSLVLPASSGVVPASPPFKPSMASLIPTAISPWHTHAQPHAHAGFAPEPAGPELLPASDDQHEVGEFKWYSGLWNRQPTLLAIRPVRWRDRTFHQGFAVASATLSDWIFDGGFPAWLEAGKPAAGSAALLPFTGTDWHVVVDPSPALRTAARQERTLRRQFHYSYFGGLFGALLAGSCVVALVWHSGRLARERSRFAAAAAHELRTPLAGIRLHGEMLASALGNPQRISSYAQRITDEAERLGRVVANVLNHTREDNRRLVLDRQPGDLVATVKQCLTVVEPLVEQSGASLDVRIARELPAIPFDPDAIHQILRNLIDNAEKYTRKAEERRIEIRLRAAAQGGVELVVADHGAGVAPALRPHLFRPFANADTASKQAGLGLGLSVVDSLVRAHGGRVSHSDTPGGGATFSVFLPA